MSGSPFDAGSSPSTESARNPPVWTNIDQMKSIAPLPGVTMWPVSGNNLMLNFVRIEPGASVPDHQHRHEQAGAVLEGTLILTLAGETRELNYGDAYIAPPHTIHSATCGPEGCLVIDIFSPPREDYVLD